MLFSEIYSSYFRTVEAILAEAVDGDLTQQRLAELVREKAFGESVLTIPVKLKDGSWPLLTEDLKTPLGAAPQMPLTTLEKRWLKALLQDPRIRLFSPSEAGLEDVEPLYDPDTFVYFDQYNDGDPFDDPDYIAHFQTILQALRQKRKLRIQFTGAWGRRNTWNLVPYKLEYSAKDDKFRLLAAKPTPATVNLGRIERCELLEPYSPQAFHLPQVKMDTLVMELTDERNALERAMLHFSHFEKQTERLEGNRYRVTLRYSREDETELVIRLLSFGPVLKVLSPQNMVDELKRRILRQRLLSSKAGRAEQPE